MVCKSLIAKDRSYMKFKKLSLLVLLLFIIASCDHQRAQPSRWGQENGKLKVLTTIAMINDIVKEVGGDDVDTIALIRGELDPHSYELVKGDDEKFSRADLIFYNGLGLEHGLSLRQNLIGNAKAVPVAEPILQKNPDLILKIDHQYDPHVWMDIALWMYTIDPIVKALSDKDPLHSDSYYARGEILRQKMQITDEKMYNILQAIPPEKRYLVTSHDAFHYFTRHYLAEPGEKNWQNRCRAPEGLAPEAQLSVCDLIAIIDHIENFNISVLFPESNVSKDSLRKIVNAAKEKGFVIRLCKEELYGDSMGNASSYLDMISHNVELIAQEFNDE